ncbi:hypothetical protein BJ508DRAFT_381998 [Ascobolus immersus RN42]|uniref:Uncharacterized protein n=1 Tax=Ascobolus immersus RN42 TaxID=1160509 RepID=A0A3N4HAC0_ASCIM|nr:hypothetical protein BJ508DRAFT_381998 [Ascobolus immersus RN42]
MYCELTNILVNNPFQLLDLLNSETSTAESVQDYIISEIRPLLRVGHSYYILANKLEGLKNPDVAQRLKGHIGGWCKECRPRTDTEVMKEALEKYEPKRVAMHGGQAYLERCLDAREKSRVAREKKRQKDAARFAELQREMQQEREREAERLEATRRLNKRVDGWRKGCYCAMVVAASKNPKLSDLLQGLSDEGVPDRMPTAQANIILEREFCRYESNMAMTDEERTAFRESFGKQYGNHFRVLRVHLFGEHSRIPGIPNCPAQICSTTEDGQVVRLKRMLERVEMAVRKRMKREAITAKAQAEELAIAKERKRLRDLKEQRLEKKRERQRLSFKVEKRRCHIALALSMHPMLIARLQEETSWFTWVDLTGRIVKQLHLDYSSQTEDGESKFSGGAWRPGKVVGEELLSHLFGTRWDSMACPECPKIPFVKAMMDLIANIPEKYGKVDVHFQRPLDSYELQTVSKLRKMCYEKATNCLSVAKLRGDAARKLTRQSSSSAEELAPEARLERAGASLFKLLQRFSNERREHVHISNVKTRRGKVTSYSPLKDAGIDKLWDSRVPATTLLADYAKYLKAQGFKNCTEQSKFAPTIAQLLRSFHNSQERKELSCRRCGSVHLSGSCWLKSSIRKGKPAPTSVTEKGNVNSEDGKGQREPCPNNHTRRGLGNNGKENRSQLDYSVSSLVGLKVSSKAQLQDITKDGEAVEVSHKRKRSLGLDDGTTVSPTKKAGQII